MANDLPPHQTGAGRLRRPKTQSESPLWCGGLIESFSGIRGIYGKGVTPDLLRRYIFCYCRMFRGKLKAVVVGGDTRPSTPFLKKTAVSTFRECGVQKIIDVGAIPIQVAEYAILKFKADGGIYITASHNEPDYNGWKILKEDGALIYASQSEKLIAAVHKLKTGGCSLSMRSHRKLTAVINKENEAIDCYAQYVLNRLGKKAVQAIRKARPQILVDPNGGSSVKILKKIFSLLGVPVKFVNDQPGRFSRKVEPNRESLAYLDRYLEKEQFEFAAGFDSDADRVELVVAPQTAFAKELGSVVSGNYVLSLACDAMLSGTKGQVVVTNDVTAYLVRDVIKKYQAKMKEVEVGELSLIHISEPTRPY